MLYARYERMLSMDLLDGEPAGIVSTARVVGHPEVGVAPRTGGLGHFGERVGTIGEICVAVEQPLDVPIRHKRRQALGQG